MLDLLHDHQVEPQPLHLREQALLATTAGGHVDVQIAHRRNSPRQTNREQSRRQALSAAGRVNVSRAAAVDQRGDKSQPGCSQPAGLLQTKMHGSKTGAPRNTGDDPAP
jgi:hypothetical protein